MNISISRYKRDFYSKDFVSAIDRCLPLRLFKEWSVLRLIWNDEGRSSRRGLKEIGMVSRMVYGGW